MRRVAAWLMRRRGAARAGLAAALGAVGCAAFAPVHFPPALLVSLAGLIFLVDGARGLRGAFVIGFAWGAGHFAVGLYWIGNAFLVAGEALWAAPFAVAALAALCALYPAAACALYRGLAPRGLWRPAVFASAWILGEWLRGGFPLGGFPWGLAGYVWTPWPVMVQFAAVAGVYGLGWFTVFAAASPAALADRPSGRRASSGSWAPAAALALLVVNAGAGAVVLARADAAPAPQARLRLVQANIGQADKWRADLIGEHFGRYEALSTAPGAPTLTVWPETASPRDLSQDFPEREYALRSVPPGGALVTGALRRAAAPDGRRSLWNSLQALDDEGRVVGEYDKARLVPFGEYVPFSGLPLVAALMGDATNFARGPGAAHPRGSRRAALLAAHLLRGDLPRLGRRPGGAPRVAAQRHQRRLVRRQSGAAPAFRAGPPARGGGRLAARARGGHGDQRRRGRLGARRRQTRVGRDRNGGRRPAAAAPADALLAPRQRAGDGFLSRRPSRLRRPEAGVQNCTRRVRPPSTTRLAPVMKLAAGLARNTAAFATSPGPPMRPIGLLARAAL